MLVLAHRGYHKDVPENSLESLLAARRAGFDGVEFDIRRCGSGELVLYHDEDVDGQPLSEMSLGELQSARPEVPTLGDAVRVLGRTGGWVNAELKETGIAAETISIILGVTDTLLVTSFLSDALREAAYILPKEHLGRILCPGLGGSWFRELTSCRGVRPARMVCPSWGAWRRLPLAFVPSRTMVWNVPSGTALGRLRSAGVFAAITDHAEALS